jgi:hypothetical protein
MRKVKEERSKKSKSSSGSKSSKKDKKKKKDKRRTLNNGEPPMSSVQISGEDDKSVGTASTITISSYTHASCSKPLKHWQEFSTAAASEACVTRMPYIDHRGDRGWYTGDVDAMTGTPNGYGTMNFSNGAVMEGEWKDGVFHDEPQQHIPSSSPTSSKIRHHGRKLPPPLETHYEDDSNRSSSRSRLPQKKVVCGMLWTDSEGSGCYTGEVNGLNIPEGVGSMRYHSGLVVEGLWREGEMEEDAN